jgi:DCN1-like protein 1/2
MLGSQKKAKALKDFRQLTNTTEKVAKPILEKFDYNVERAVDHFFATNPEASADKSASATPKGAQSLDKIFNNYAGKGADADTMADEKLVQFFADVGVKQDEGPMAFVVSFRLKCKNVGEISRKEFCTGFGEAGCDSLPKIAAHVRSMKATVLDKGQSDQYRQFYRWVFDFNKESPERKTIEKEQALDLWRLILDPTKMPLCEKFIAFCEKDKDLKLVSKDLWDQAYEFGVDIKPDLSNWSDDGAWPVTIDDFVQHLLKEKEKGEEKKR